MDYNSLVFDWAYIVGNLDVVFGDEKIEWEKYGFSREGIRWAVSTKHQLVDRETMELVTLYPIEKPSLFVSTLGGLFNSGNERYKVINQEACQVIHAELLMEDAEMQIKVNSTPTEDEVYKSQVLLLLTELANK